MHRHGIDYSVRAKGVVPAEPPQSPRLRFRIIGVAENEDVQEAHTTPEHPYRGYKEVPQDYMGGNRCPRPSCMEEKFGLDLKDEEGGLESSAPR